MNGNVASDLFRWKTTVSSPLVSIRSRESSIPAGPPLKWMSTMRSMENFTASASSFSPLENVRFFLSVHRYAMLVASVNLQESAASGSGLVLPEGKLTRVW